MASPGASQARSRARVKIDTVRLSGYRREHIFSRDLCPSRHRDDATTREIPEAAALWERRFRRGDWAGDAEGKGRLPSDRASGGPKRRRRALTRALAPVALVGFGLAAVPNSTESAIANGDTRTIVLCNGHTNESGSFTYMVDGVYDPPTLEKLNWFLRDWRLNEPTKMDPKLFDIVWEVYRESGSTQPIDVLSGYRSPHTNAMLRRRSRQVAKYSQHMEGKAIDAHFLDVDTATIRDVAMRMQAGGVGFYPSGLTPWVHIDSGDVRYWPRMSRVALTRLFPDGKTVFIPADGQPMPGFEQARAEIEARGGEVRVASADNAKPGFFAWLFGDRGGGADDAEEADGAEAAPPPGRGGARLALAAAAPAPQPTPQVVASADSATKTDASPAAASDDAAADEFIAPLPPRKPADILAAQLALFDAPTPPPRPAEFAIAAQAAADADQSDLIAALIRRGRLPGAITRGLAETPPEALALADPVAPPEPPERTAALARAAQLAASLPPLPPARPMAAVVAAADGRSTATRTNAVAAAAAAAPVVAPKAVFRVASLLTAPDLWRDSPNPYGDLVYDAFLPGAPPAPAGGLAALRGPTP